MMLYRNVLNFLRGSVQVEIECACPERVLNLCAVEEIAFWDLQWLSPIVLRLRVTRRGWHALREVCTRADAQASRLRERGAPQLLLRLRTRYALLAALALFALLLFGGNLFIWSFEVTGNETVPTETILRALEKCGVAVGSQGLKIHQEDVRNRALLELPDVAWLAVNVRGCVAHVQVVERKRPPAVVQESQVCNVVARREGLVTRVQALDGKAVAAPGSVVTEGELLISGVADSERSGLRLLNCHSADAVMVGDRMDTDVISGLESGMSTVLVLSGVSTEETLNTYSYRPSVVLPGVGDIVKLARGQQ